MSVKKSSYKGISWGGNILKLYWGPQNNIQNYSYIIEQANEKQKQKKLEYRHQNVNLIMSKSTKTKIYIQINVLP